MQSSDQPAKPSGDRSASAPSGPSSELLRRLASDGVRGTRYRIEGELARGGMGAILRVHDDELGRDLAMKVVLGEADSRELERLSDSQGRYLARFLEEAQITGQLDHPGIVPVHELGIDSDGRLYFTMKLVKGRELREILPLVRGERDGWNRTRALSIILKVCEAVAYAHSKGVIHRDIKPANIMVGEFGEVYVMDWGLARSLGRRDSHDVRLRTEVDSARSIRTERRREREESSGSPLVTMDGDVVGTPCYMSPEQAQGRIAELGPRSDVYSVGALLYELLSGQMPYVEAGAKLSFPRSLSRSPRRRCTATRRCATRTRSRWRRTCARSSKTASSPRTRRGRSPSCASGSRATSLSRSRAPRRSSSL
jgi:serine/threonine protein kinase